MGKQDDMGRLLDLLAPGEPVTFQTFGEGECRGGRGLSKILHGTLAEHADALATLNRRGAGVFWMPNAGDLRGRKAHNVRHVRALFVDLDGAPLAPVTDSPLQPHAVVESSPGRWHAYWRVADCSLAAFAHYQQQLAGHFSGDDSVIDLPRVMRLPGFWHRKAAPFLSRLASANDGKPFVLSDFHDALGLPPYTETQETHETQETQETQVREGGIALAKFLPEGPGTHQRNKCLFGLARHLKALVPDAGSRELRELVKEWHALALPLIGTADFSESWGDFARAWESVRHPEGEFMRVLMAGVDDDPLPEGLPDDYEPTTLRLIRACGRLQGEAGDDPFFLSARTASELLGLHYTSAASMLAALVADGVLIRVSKGDNRTRQASEYLLPVQSREAA